MDVCFTVFPRKKSDYSSEISTANIPKQVLYICVQNLELNNGL